MPQCNALIAIVSSLNCSVMAEAIFGALCDDPNNNGPVQTEMSHMSEMYGRV